jgi:hypothetical protein
MSGEVLELFGFHALGNPPRGWGGLMRAQHCPFLAKKCIKVRKSDPDTAIGTCVVAHGKENRPIVICPHRLLERRQVFTDAVHLLRNHKPGQELHVVPEVSIPGGHVDYFVVSAKRRKVVDFVGVELQTLDTTGSVWPSRRRFLNRVGVRGTSRQHEDKPFGMNWKMTAKTILVQLHHKTTTFEHLSKHLVLVVQDCLLEYVRRAFVFDHVTTCNDTDTLHIHAYELVNADSEPWGLDLAGRWSTDSNGVARCLGLQAEARMELSDITSALEAKMSDQTIWSPE